MISFSPEMEIFYSSLSLLLIKARSVVGKSNLHRLHTSITRSTVAYSPLTQLPDHACLNNADANHGIGSKNYAAN
jgi:hypothetical protein